MIRKSPQYDLINPPGQIHYPTHLEMPLTKAVEAFRDEEINGLVRRVQQLENELKWTRQENLRLYTVVCRVTGST